MSPRTGSRGTGGFTLLELMIVLVVAGVLAAVAYPVYQDHVRQARRADGHALLLDAAARQQRFFFDNGTYATNMLELGYGAAAPSSPDGNFNLSAAAGPTASLTSSYLLTAALAAGVSDPECTTLTLDSRGVQGHTGSAPSADVCW